jgi:hypothetical protein
MIWGKIPSKSQVCLLSLGCGAAKPGGLLRPTGPQPSSRCNEGTCLKGIRLKVTSQDTWHLLSASASILAYVYAQVYHTPLTGIYNGAFCSFSIQLFKLLSVVYRSYFIFYLKWIVAFFLLKLLAMQKAEKRWWQLFLRNNHQIFITNREDWRQGFLSTKTQ